MSDTDEKIGVDERVRDKPTEIPTGAPAKAVVKQNGAGKEGTEASSVITIKYDEWVAKIRRGAVKAIMSLILGKGLDKKILDTSVEIRSRSTGEKLESGIILSFLREMVVYQLIKLMNLEEEEVKINKEEEQNYWKVKVRALITDNSRVAVELIMKGIEVQTPEDEWHSKIIYNIENPTSTLITDVVDHFEAVHRAGQASGD